MSYSGFSEEPWALARAPGAAFCNVAKEVAAATITQKEKAAVQAAEDKIGKFTDQLTKLGDPKRWTDRVEAARAIPEAQKMVDELSQIEHEKAGLPSVQAELETQIVVEIKRMYPVAIRLIEAVIKRIDNELAKIKIEQTKVDEFWGLQTTESSNWLVFGILRLKSGLESNLHSLKTADPGQISICRYCLAESGVLQPRARVQSP